MDAREWALVIFTILMQMSVGAFVVLGIVHAYVLRKANAEEASRMSDRALLAIGPVVVLGILASLFHLGNPLNAPRAIANLATSWLSWEILLSLVFVVLGAVFALMQWRKMGSFAVRNVVAWLAAVSGLALVYTMAKVYMLETQPAWNTMATMVMFYATTFLLGSLAIGAALMANYSVMQRSDPSCGEAQCTLLRDVVRGISLAGIIFLGVELVVVPLQIAYLAAGGPEAAQSAALMFTEFGSLMAIRLVLVFLGAGVFGLFLYRTALSAGREKMIANLIYSAFALVLVAEVIGRFIFYASHVQIGL
jgi:anaerobic dimethyl sulfoxide reductase subunit C